VSAGEDFGIGGDCPASKAAQWSDPIELTKRKTWTDKQKAQVWLKCGGMCVSCGSKNKLEIDHEKNLANGGTNDLENLFLLCYDCHKTKSKTRDWPSINKAKRVEKKHRTVKKPSKLKSRGFDKTKTKGFDNKVKPKKLTIKDKGE
jgi:5-methylcytosine-specific restriction endonuclease McrA